MKSPISNDAKDVPTSEVRTAFISVLLTGHKNYHDWAVCDGMKKPTPVLARQSFRESEYGTCTKKYQAQLLMYEESSLQERNIPTVRTHLKYIIRNKKLEELM